MLDDTNTHVIPVILKDWAAKVALGRDVLGLDIATEQKLMFDQVNVFLGSTVINTTSDLDLHTNKNINYVNYTENLAPKSTMLLENPRTVVEKLSDGGGLGLPNRGLLYYKPPHKLQTNIPNSQNYEIGQP